MLDKRELHVATPEAVYTVSTINVPWVQTQVELLRSQTIAAEVVGRLGLDQSPEFRRQSIWARFANMFARVTHQPSAIDLGESRRAATSALQRWVTIARVGETYMIDLKATTNDPIKSAAVVGAVIQAYTDQTAGIARALAESSSAWLRDRTLSAGPAAQVVTVASPPEAANPPGLLTVMALSGLAGLLLGMGAAVATDYFDSKVRTPEALAAALQRECLGVLPAGSAAVATDEDEALRANSVGADLFGPVDAAGSLLMQAADRAATVLVLERGARSVGITSDGTDQGALVACRIAAAISASARKVLLIDAAGGAGSITNQISGSRDRPGLLDIAGGHSTFEQAAVIEVARDIDFLPLGVDGLMSSSVFAGPEIAALLRGDSATHGFTVVCLPPLAPSSAVRSAAHSLDALILVVGWGTSTLPQLVDLVTEQPVVGDKLVGIVMADVDLDVYRDYPASRKWTGLPSRDFRAGLYTLWQSHGKTSLQGLATRIRANLARYVA